jgi:glycosyltransferase involved in cell wall biosynthesis
LQLSVILTTHNPDPARLRRTLAGLQAQTLSADTWECIVVDNASHPPVDLAPFADVAPVRLRFECEMQLGLTAGRRRGLSVMRSDLAILVDDDNVLAPDYLAHAATLFAAHPQLGAAGGPSRPEFEIEPAPWTHEFFPLLALRDLGSEPKVGGLLRAPSGTHFLYPPCAPIGAGMALRRAALDSWLRSVDATMISDRRGTALTSGGDNDIVLSVLHAGWEVGYFPELSLTHLIPTKRVEPAYLARLNRGIQKSWMLVLYRHNANGWPPIARGILMLRKLKAWWTYRAWRGPIEHIRWQGACGHFEGRASHLSPNP